MVQKIKTSRKHPYVAFENTKEWIIIQKALNDLALNGDLVTQTAEPYIVGYIVKKLKEKDS